jgi:hypothetical protein
MFRCERSASGIRLIALANFAARIVRDRVFDKGAESSREFTLEAELAGHKLSFAVPADEFGRMRWVFHELGPEAIIFPGQQQHARAAIQHLSGTIPQEVVYSHLGWRKHGNDWVYLHSGGAIAAGRPVTDAHVQLPSLLERYRVQAPSDRDSLTTAVCSSLRFLSVAPDRITLPLLAAVYRASFGDTDFGVFLTGRSGAFKTALAAICQQHFGAAMDAGHLPGNFASTANALEELAFQAKDALLVVDDFVPTAGSGDSALEALAERLFRAAGNRQGRTRMGGPRLHAPHPPRALLLATGERVPQGSSIRARLLIVDVRPGEVDRARLSRTQAAADEGQFATAMGAYLAWIARDYENIYKRLHTRCRELRGEMLRNGTSYAHARLPGILAELHSSWELWLEFALEVGAINPTEQVALKKRSLRALNQLAAIQSSYQQASEPATRFLSLLRAALAEGRAHVVVRRGGAPEFPERWGWRLGRRIPVAQGVRIGWLAGNDLYLEPAISYQVAQEMAAVDAFSVSLSTLSRRMRERGLLASVDENRQMLMVRRTLESSPRKVLHLRSTDLVGFASDSAGNAE